MTSGIASKGVDLDGIFDPWMSGTGKARTTGISVAGSDLNNRFAPLIYGSSAPATGIQSQGADLNTLFAAKGTAQYALPINGQTYMSNGASTGTGAITAQLNFQIGTSGWTLVKSGTNETTTTIASGAVPSGAVSVQITDTWLNAAGDTDAGTTNNTAASYTTIPSSGTVGCDVIESHSGTSGQTTHKIVILMKTSGGNVISNTTTTFICYTSRG